VRCERRAEPLACPFQRAVARREARAAVFQKLRVILGEPSTRAVVQRAGVGSICAVQEIVRFADIRRRRVREPHHGWPAHAVTVVRPATLAWDLRDHVHHSRAIREAWFTE
jgi:hypothetical protein